MVTSFVASAQFLSFVQLFRSLRTVACQVPSPWDSPGENNRVACHFLLQGFFPIQGSNWRLSPLLHWPPGKPKRVTSFEERHRPFSSGIPKRGDAEATCQLEELRRGLGEHLKADGSPVSEDQAGGGGCGGGGQQSLRSLLPQGDHQLSAALSKRKTKTPPRR